MKSNKKLNKALVAALVTSAVFGVNTTAHAASETNLNSNTGSTTNVESKAEDSETYEVVDIEKATSKKVQNQGSANSGLSIPKTEDVSTKEYKDGTVEKKETESTNKDNTSEDKKEDTKENNQEDIYSDIKNKGESVKADSYESSDEVAKNKLPEVLKENINKNSEIRRDYSEISVPDIDIYKYSKKTDKTGKTTKTNNESINTLFKVTADDTGESHIVYTDMYGRLQNINYLPFGKVSNVEIDDLDLTSKDVNGDSKISDILSIDNGLNYFNPFAGDKNLQELDRKELKYDPSNNAQADRSSNYYDNSTESTTKYAIDDIKNLKDDDYVLGKHRLKIQNPENQDEPAYVFNEDGSLVLQGFRNNKDTVIYKAEDIYGNDNIKSKDGVYNMDDVNVNSVVNFGMKKKDYVNALEKAKAHKMLRVFLPSVGEERKRTLEEAENLLSNGKYIDVLKEEYGDDFVVVEDDTGHMDEILKTDPKVYTYIAEHENLKQHNFMRQRILYRLMYKNHQKDNNFTIEEQDLKGVKTLSDLNPFITKVNKNLTYRDLLGLNLITYTNPASKTYTFEELRTNTNYGKSLAKFQLQANPDIDMHDYAKKYADKLEFPSCNLGGFAGSGYGGGSTGGGAAGPGGSYGGGSSGAGNGGSGYGSGGSNSAQLMSFMISANASGGSSSGSVLPGVFLGKRNSSMPPSMASYGNPDICRIAPPKTTFSLVNLRNGQKIVKNEDSGYFHVINEDMVVNTKAYDKADNDQIITPSKKSIIVDEINVDKFDANKSYKLVGKIVDENGNDIADFQPKDIELKDILKKNEKTGYAEGKLTVEYELDTSNFEDGSRYVLVYDIYEKDINDKEGVYVQTGDHFNLSDKAQTFTVKKDPTCPVPDESIPWYPLTPGEEENKDNSIPWYPLTPAEEEKEEDTCKKVSIPMVNLIPAEKLEGKIDGGTPEKDCEDKSIPWYPLIPAEAKETKDKNDKDNNKVEITEKQDKNDVIKETPTNNTNEINRKRAPQTGVTGISGYVVSALLSSVGLGITKKKRK